MAARSFSLPKDRVLITGSPRNDALFDENINISGKVIDIIEEIHKKGGHVGFYMPTHRAEGGEEMIKTITNNLELCQNLLERKNIYLLVKLHQFHQQESSTKVLKNITYVSNQDLDGDIYPYFPKTDFLITDYSTVYIDYLLVDKPIIFLNYDIKQYTSMHRKLYFHYEEVTPGPKVSSWNQLIPTLSKELDKDSHKKSRQKMREFFHAYSDGNSSKRIAEKVYNDFVKTG